LKLLISPSFGGVWEALYSYGDSTGITPDFPFNPLPEAEKPNRHKCRERNNLSRKSFQQ